MEELSQFTSHISFLWKWFKHTRMFQQNKKVNQKGEKCGVWEIIKPIQKKYKAELGWQLFPKSSTQKSNLELMEQGLQKVGIWEENVYEQK